MPEPKAIPYTWLYTDGGADVPVTDSHSARVARNEKDATPLMRTIIRLVGPSAAARILAEVAAEEEERAAEKGGGK